MLASLLLSGLVLAEPGGTISYHKKVMIDPDYRPSRTRDQIETALSRARVAVPRRTVYRTVYRPVSEEVRPVAVQTVRDEPRVSWNVGLLYGGYHDGWGARVGVGYGYPATYSYAYAPYAYSSPWSWSVGLGYATSWGYLGLGYSSAWSCGSRYYGPSSFHGGRRSYRAYGGRHHR